MLEGPSEILILIRSWFIANEVHEHELQTTWPAKFNMLFRFLNTLTPVTSPLGPLVHKTVVYNKYNRFRSDFFTENLHLGLNY